jgi:hypothetical protein
MKTLYTVTAGCGTFEIFESLGKAKNFAKWLGSKTWAGHVDVWAGQPGGMLA